MYLGCVFLAHPKLNVSHIHVAIHHHPFSTASPSHFSHYAPSNIIALEPRILRMRS